MKLVTVNDTSMNNVVEKCHVTKQGFNILPTIK